MVREFPSEEKLLEYENEIKSYYGEVVDDNTKSWKFYARLFRDMIHPYYRKLKKEYEDYEGGYFYDDQHNICSNDVNFLPTEYFPRGQIILQREGNKITGVYMNIGKQWAEVDLWKKKFSTSQ